MNVLDLALAKDIGKGDITSNALFPKSHRTKAVIIAREPGVMAGGEEAKYVFERCGAKAFVKISDGGRFHKGDVVMRVRGQTRAVLCAERTALNILGRMCGIATTTARLSRYCTVAATRKGPPGLAMLDKKAVRLGGGLTHRMGLWDMTLIKDTHLDSLGLPRGAAIRAAMGKAKKPIEIEVGSGREAILAASLGADIIMLDNFTPDAAKKTVKLMRKGYPSVAIELSGGINQENIAEFARAKPDFVSLGMLTNAARPIDFTMKIVK